MNLLVFQKFRECYRWFLNINKYRIRDYSNIFQNLKKSFRSFENIPVYPKILLKPYRHFLNVFECCRTLIKLQEYFSIFQKNPKCSRMVKNFPKCSKFFPMVRLQYSRILKNHSKGSRKFRNALKCCRVYSNFFGIYKAKYYAFVKNYK